MRTLLLVLILVSPLLAETNETELVRRAYAEALTVEEKAGKNRARAALNTLGLDKLRVLMEHVHVPNMYIRFDIDALVHRNRDKVGPTLLPFLESPHPRTRSYAAYYLGFTPLEENRDKLVPLLDHPATQNSAIRTLGKWGGTNQLERIATFVDHENERRRITALNALRDLGDPAATPHILPALDDEMMTVRFVAERALTVLGDTEAIGNALSGASDKARWHLKNALDEIELQARGPQFVQKQEDGRLEIWHKDVNLLTYHTGIVDPPEGADPAFKRSGFIHPLRTPKGAVVTGMQPKDHLHHLGIWHAMVRGTWGTKAFDSWNLKKRQGKVAFIESLGSPGGPAAFEVRQGHFAMDGERETLVLDETMTVTCAFVDGAFEIDYKIVQKNVTDKPLVFKPFRYGCGIAYRAPHHWDQTNSDYLSSEGKTRVDGHTTRSKWCSFWGPDEKTGKKVSLTIMDHPDNFDAPTRMRVWDAKTHNGAIFFNYVPRQEKELRYDPGTSHTFVYRLIVADGLPSLDALASRWARFSGE